MLLVRDVTEVGMAYEDEHGGDLFCLMLRKWVVEEQVFLYRHLRMVDSE